MTADFWQQAIRGFPKPFDPWANPAGCTFDEATANRVCAYWEKTYTLKDGKFAGLPFKLEPWQRKIVGHLFGWKRPDGTRRFRVLFLYVPKKNGKTQLGAGLGLTLLHADGEAGAEVFSCASNVDQAKIVFDAAVQMVANNTGLSKKIRVYKGYRALEYTQRKCYWKVLSSRAESKHGPNVHGLLIDELHTQRDNELIETLEAGTVSRAQPLIIKMTTADHTGETPCNTELEYARGVRDGTIEDPYYMPIIFDGQDRDSRDANAWKDPDFWRAVNPNFGITVGDEFFAREVRKCGVNPSHLLTFKRLHLDIQTDVVSQWLDYDAWMACGKTGIEKTGPCYAALDLASSTDITAMALYWPETKSLSVRTWVPEATAERRAEYVLWRKAGAIEVTDGAIAGYAHIRAAVNQAAKDHDLHGVAYDPWNATHLVSELADEDEVEMTEFRQGFITMNAPSKAFERLVIGGELRHENNPCLNWMAKNVAVKSDPANNIKPIKPALNSTKKIDGIVAAIMAIGLANADRAEPQPTGPMVVTI